MDKVSKSKLTSKGQITVPKAVRDRLGLRPGDEIEFVPTSKGFALRKFPVDSPFEGWSGYLEHLRGVEPDKLVEEMRGR